MDNIILFIIAFIFGALVGSFLNVAILRLKINQKSGRTTINLKGRSKCPKCKKELNIFELVPILSFLFLRGRCSRCKKNISWQYPLVETASGILTALTFCYLGFDNPNSYLILPILYCLIIIFVYDLRNFIVPDAVLAIMFCLVLIFDIIKITQQQVVIIDFLWGLVIGGGIFLVLVYFSKERWMGWGDVKFGFVLGLMLPYPFIILCLVAAFIIGAVVAILLIILKKAKMKGEIPFAPFLVVAAVITLFWGREIISWYLRGF